MDLETAPGTDTGRCAAEQLHRIASPDQSLQRGQWVKLICGASYQDMPTVRRLVMLYALAGVDCLDVAADGAVVAAARQGLADAVRVAPLLGPRSHLLPGLPWLMVSLNDSEDPHFRKAQLEAAHCPPDCDRPCEPICPTAAIQFASPQQGGVTTDLCYGCGRCIAVCPVGNIAAQSYLASPETFPAEQLAQIDAVEIHTQTGNQAQFTQLWQRLQPWRSHLKLISISCPDHDQVVPYLRDLYHLMTPLEVPLIWQTDGRPMSGDLGKGTTHATIRLAEKILQAGLPGFVQPAGGTNGYTVSKLLNLGLVNHKPPLAPAPLASAPRTIAGIAYGSYGRSQVLPLLDAIDQELQPWLGNGFPDQPTTGQTIEVSPPGSSASPSANASPAAGQWPHSSALDQGLTVARQLVEQIKLDRHFLSARYGQL